MRIGQDVLSDLPRALACEWLLGNGLGGTSLGDAASALARGAHGLLVTHGRHGARIALLALDERLVAGDETFDLATRLLSGGVAKPAGHLRLAEFRLDPWPVWRWTAGGVTLERSLFLVEGHDAVAVAYRHVEGPAARLIVAPVVVARGPGGRQREDSEFQGAVKGQPGRVRIETIADAPALTLWHNGAFLPARLWLRGIEHPLDPTTDQAPARPAGGRGRARAKAADAGAGEDAFAAGYVEARLEPGGTLHLVAATEDDVFKALAREGRLGTPPPHSLAGCVTLLESAERERIARLLLQSQQGADLTARQALAAHGGAPVPQRRERVLEPDDPWVARVARAFDAGLVRRGFRTTLLATLPSGPERGADALRALPGLVSLRAFEHATAVLRGYVEYLDEGFVPEGFDDEGTPHYGDPAPSLWLIHAGDVLARRHGDLQFVTDELYPMLESVMQYFRAGTRGGVKVDGDGLLSIGTGEHAEKPAELNVLWYHALVAMAQLARLVGRRENSAFYLAWARDHQRRFLETLWDETHGLLYRTLSATGPGPGPRPGHLLAASLSPAILPADRAVRLVESLEAALLTPVGLRAEPGSDTALPEWLGTAIAAHLRVHGRGPDAQGWARDRLDTFFPRLGPCGQVPERFVCVKPKGAPERWLAAGEPASIVAASELLRVSVEELDPVESAATVG